MRTNNDCNNNINNNNSSSSKSHMINDDVEEEKDYFAKFEQEPEFRNFVRKLSRCRSIASLGTNNVVAGDNIDDEKGKDNIKTKDYKQSNTKQRRHQNQVLENYSNTDHFDNRTGRGDNHNKVGAVGKTRRYSDIQCYNREESGFFGNNDQRHDYSKRSSASPGIDYSSLTLPRREKRASVILREKHQNMMMIQETNEDASKSGVFTLPRVSCYHRSTR